MKEEPKRLEPTKETIRELFAKSGNICAFPKCTHLMIDEEGVFIGQVCHIEAAEPGGERFNPSMTNKERRAPENLILMCYEHHKKTNNVTEYTVEILQRMKKEHERKFTNHANVILNEIQTIIEPWCERMDIDNWNVWTSYLMSDGQPSIDAKMYENLKTVGEWLLSRIWSKEHNELKMAFENFGYILNDLLNIFSKHAKKNGDYYLYEKFYHYSHNEDETHKLFEFNVYLIQDLVLELTRSANYVCKVVRKCILPDFRLQEGLLLVTYGPCMDFTFRTVKVSYNKPEDSLYVGLEKFKEIRETRDIHMGAGVSIDDSKFLKWYGNY